MVANMCNDVIDVLNALHEENEELKQRNNRQAKQLDRLYNLIEEKDWRTLSDIIDDFKRCEEQLQREWGTYGDFE
jgi:prephenate dehydrogenase